MTSLTCYRESGSRIVLGDDNFLGKGGEKAVYGRDGLAYCVYHDPLNAVPEKKIAELSKINDDRVIKPIELLYGKSHQRIGEVTKLVDDSYVLCQLFGNKFCKSNGIDNPFREKISAWMIEIMKNVHNAKCLMIDPNDCNWLVPKKLDTVYAIDTSAFQTPSFPATVIKPGIRDYSADRFCQGTDWFSMAVILGWLWVGMHPYATHHPDYTDGASDMPQRIKKRVSCYDPKTQFNAACRPLGNIPIGLNRWLEDTLNGRSKDPAPERLGSTSKSVKAGVNLVSHSGKSLKVELLETLMSDPYDYQNGQWVFSDKSALTYGETKHELVELTMTGAKVIGKKKAIPCANEIAADSLFYASGRAYVIYKNKLSRVRINDRLPTNDLSVSFMTNVSENRRQIKTYHGVVLHDFSTKWAMMFGDDGRTYNKPLSELSDHKIMNARAEQNVLVVHSESKRRYYQSIYVFDFEADITRFSQLELPGYCDVSFAIVTKKNLLITFDGDRKLYVRSLVELSRVKVVKDNHLTSDCYLYTTDAGPRMVVDNKVYSIAMV